MTDYNSILDCYSLEEILELNDITLEEALTFLHEEKFIKLPENLPLEFDD